MKQIKGNIIRDVICAVCVLALAAYCSSQKWLLMFRGQQEMFLFDWGYVKDILLHPGGLAEVIARFLTQFFTVSGVGVVVTLVLLGLNAWMVWKLMERTACTGGQFERTVTSTGSVTGKRFDKLSDREVWGIFPLCLLPSVFLAVSLLDYYCFYQGLIADRQNTVHCDLSCFLSAGIFKNKKKAFALGQRDDPLAILSDWLCGTAVRSEGSALRHIRKTPKSFAFSHLPRHLATFGIHDDSGR